MWLEGKRTLFPYLISFVYSFLYCIKYSLYIFSSHFFDFLQQIEVYLHLPLLVHLQLLVLIIVHSISMGLAGYLYSAYGT